jgi:LmbE family N-acetylglucosaminyl deacetylase
VTDLRDEPGRTVVLSPHLDDAVLSLGAMVAGLTRTGTRVDVVTVLAGDPGSDAVPSEWDRRAGFATAGEAARARREEDRRACRLVGATPVWLTHAFRDGEPPDEELVWGQLAETLEGAGRVLVPGTPLEHPEHAWVHRLVVARAAPGTSIALYAEQPYLRWSAAVAPPEFERVRSGLRDRLAKSRATACYASQLPLLGRGSRLAMLRELRRAGDELATAVGP